MDKEKYDLSPIECSHWIEHGAFDYLQKEETLKGTAFEKFKTIYKQRFEANLSKVECLIKNELDKGNIAFVLTTVSCFEALKALGIPENEAFQLTNDCINRPMYPYLVTETKKSFDNAENPFQTLIQASKDREENYFGNSFHFERPVDNEYGYVLHIKKCLFHETLKVLDRKELQPILCQMDLGWIDAIEPNKHLMQFARPVTFATGNTCQMWFMRKEKKLTED